MAIKSGCFIVVLSSFVFLTLTPVTIGQDSKTALVSIPFEFCVEGNCLPAGDYTIQHVESTSYLLFRNTNGKVSAAVFAVPLDEEPATEANSKLIFRVHNGRHYLYEGWGPFGRRVVAAESGWNAPTGAASAEVPITLGQASRP